MMKKYASEYSGCQMALRRMEVALRAEYDIWNRCGNTQLPSAMLIADVINQMAVVGELASSPGTCRCPDASLRPCRRYRVATLRRPCLPRSRSTTRPR